jgi:HAD superfamily hydrolase (TIGR01662 family)
VLRGFGHGPAAARNLGWRVTSAPWVVFVDDDVVLPQGWSRALTRDLDAASPHHAGIQARLEVPHRGGPATDWERATLGLRTSAWITADMAYRRQALAEVSGFDERFPRAYREDADLAARLLARGWLLGQGERTAVHPVRPQPGWAASLRAQRGNADDALMRRIHGAQWRRRADTGSGRFPLHLATFASGLAGAVAGGYEALAPLTGRHGGARARAVALLGAASWAAFTTEFTARRILPGPREPQEMLTMAATSALIPAAAVWHRTHGMLRHRHAQPWPPRPSAVLFDRDGTLVEDVPYNADPAAVRPVPHAADAVRRLRRHGIRVGVISNQSGVGRGLVGHEEMLSVNAEVDSQLGPFEVWRVCPHAPDLGCGCRKPRPGLVHSAARAMRVRPSECVVIGDIGADVLAARAAGARSILVPTPQTRPEEVEDAPVVAGDLAAAVDLVLAGVP